MKMFYLLKRQRRRINNISYVIFIILLLYALYNPAVLSPLIPALQGTPDKSLTPMDRLEYNNGGHQEPIKASSRVHMAKILDLPFLPRDFNCEEMLVQTGRNLTYSDAFWDHADAFKSALLLNDLIHKGTTNDQSWMIQEMARLPFVKTVCETGFDAGVNSFNWLVGNEQIEVHSFDFANKNYSAEMADFMMIEFADQFTLYPGNTALTVPKFAQQHANDSFRCDVVFIDSTPEDDIIASNIIEFRRLSNHDNNLVVMDAHRKSSNIRQAALRVWERFVDDGVIQNIFQCHFEDMEADGFGHVGLTVGAYLFPE